MIALLEATARGDFSWSYRPQQDAKATKAKGPYVTFDGRNLQGVPKGFQVVSPPGAQLHQQWRQDAEAIRIVLGRKGEQDWPYSVGRLCDLLERHSAEQNQDAATDGAAEDDHHEARADFHRGLRMVAQGRATEGLEAIDAGLFAMERVREQAGISGRDFSWLRAAPRPMRLIAPDWTASAVCAMQLHDSAGRFQVAADAGNIAVRVSGGMAAMNIPGCRELYTAVLAAAQEVWSHAEDPLRAAVEMMDPTQEATIAGGNIIHMTPSLADLADLNRALSQQDDPDQPNQPDPADDQ